MEVYLNIHGERLPVVNMSYSDGVVSAVQVINKDMSSEFIYDNKYSYFNAHAKKMNLAELLEYPSINKKIEENNEKLIQRLIDMYEEENGKLTDIAINAMESKSDLPFDTYLSDSKEEYKLLKQRVFGIIDTIEEVKAFQEGYFNQEGDK